MLALKKIKLSRLLVQRIYRFNKMSVNRAVGRRFNSTCDHWKLGQQPGFTMKY